MSLIVNEGTAPPPTRNDLEVVNANPVTTSAFTRVSNSVIGVVPTTASLGNNASQGNNRDDATPTPLSSTTSDSPPTLRRPPVEGDDDDDNDDLDASSNQGDNAFAWPTHNSYDEQRQLLGTEEESSDHASSEEEELLMENYSSGPSSASVTSGGRKRSIWSMTREQINYYMTQFFCLQSDPNGVIPGTEAKEFFERSKLPINDLRKIWQLSDVSQDGCLSLEEFLTAMHLVVLKRNNIDVPDTLPPILKPAYLHQRLSKANRKIVLKPSVPNHNKDLYNGRDATTPSNPESLNASLLNNQEDELDHAKADKKELNDVTDTASIISSPGRPAPVNFDFHRQDTLRRDPTIVQPVAVRLSPESPVVQSSDLDEDEDAHRGRRKVSRGEVGYEKLWNAAGRDDHEDDLEEKPQSGDIFDGASGPISLPASRLNKKDSTSPPPPPPRGPTTTSIPTSVASASYTRSHARSSSLDLNNFQQLTSRPPLPPRVDRLTSLASISGGGRDVRALQCKIQEYREKNSVCARTINELHQEVSDALEERIALEYQLEQLKSFGDE